MDNIVIPEIKTKADTGQIDHFIIAGQSNAVGKGDTTFSPKLAIDIASQYWNGAIRAANDPIGPISDSLYRGSAWPAFALRYNQLTGHKVAFVQCAVGATSQVAATKPEVAGTWDTTGTLFTTMIARSDSSMAAFTTAGYRVNNCGMLWLQGEQDAAGIENGSITGEDYYRRAIVMINNFHAHYGAKIPFYLIKIGAEVKPGHYGFDTIRNRQEQLAKAGYVIIVSRLAASYIKMGLMNPILTLGNLHYSQQGYNVIGINAAENVVAGYKNNRFNTPSQNTDLANLGISNGKVSPAFNPKINSYVTTLTTDTTSIVPPAADTSGVVTVNGTIVPWGAVLPVANLKFGVNTFSVSVAAPGASAANTYILAINRVPSPDASLAALTLSTGKLNPKFSPAINTYVASTNSNINSISLTPTTSDAGTVVTVNGVPVMSGVASANLPLITGANMINIIITAADGISTQTYTITVTRAPSANAKLLNLTTSSGALIPAFSNNLTSYTKAVSNNVASIIVTPTAADSTATISVNGAIVPSRSPSGYIPLIVGANVINTIVTAQDGFSRQTYTITINRAASTNAKLLSLTTSSGALSPAFINTTGTYSKAVGNNVASITFTAKAADPTAVVKVNGTAVPSGTASAAIQLAVGSNTITIAVTAQDGVTAITYSIIVNRAASSNAKLLSLTTSYGAISPAFINTTVSYTKSVSNTISNITVTAKAADPSAVITINGIPVISGAASAVILLKAGTNLITILVTAQDGVTTNAYTIILTRLPSSNSRMSALHLSDVTLSPTFIGTTNSYTAAVANTVTSTTVTPKTAEPNATVTVNGTTVTSGTASAPIALSVGSNVITMTVTAQDGITLTIYTVTITRAAAPVNSIYDMASVSVVPGMPQISNDGISVNQGLSPNGDGLNDILMIKGITRYPDNKLMIMNRSGELVYEIKGYDNITKVFDGHSSKTGAMQLPGTYFYSLDYSADGIAKHKTGFIVLKY
ncbi:cadherin-like beta sandwich domain-containing protein [Mucilaginibacter gotjawali]|uniref:Gliding motility-associated-like protein n=1 Tax=Mucilaginibacter gotjawali TaxID=1550579 RepID=A0A839SKF5_9SPHI|nr:cadherin-like beta sandwich domain-containing protein [Mucilaginibacter gotjawali]MBB3057019.1 gliding motility-associated-like protein [Mucilaginibacter gotjawali]